MRGFAGLATSHSWTVPLPLPLNGLVPLANVCPSGLNATESTNPSPVWVWPIMRGCAGLTTSHSRTVPSAPTLASVCPSGLNATDTTGPLPLAVRRWPSGRGCAGSATSQSRMLPSALPLAIVCPFGLNVTELALPASVARGEARGVFSVFSRREAASGDGWMR